MSVGPLASVVVGAPLAQSRGADVERAAQETTSQDRSVQSQSRAEAAAGIGETDGQNHETNERDADGRRPWELPARRTPEPDAGAEACAPRAKDATGQSGTQLDLSG